ncbi:SecD/SecF fusion protein [Natranaerovirga pectinivora]|uniref:Multifunctional fusion protein n=1 Tax=Natranaerovirga pectinivora TaxID=682400 RepID=A0A4V2V0K7_9FIRM|nr:protein translocase subunit SecD [Natranaerovirga pectinivora]TCT16779.1 SecD/SecF fusion protein [Natranaerovirga pectinivora]
MKGKSLLGLLLALVIIASSIFVAVSGIGPDKIGSAEDIRLGLDLAGGVSITYEAVTESFTEQEMADTIYRLQRRADRFSTEAEVYREGRTRINIDIPGVSDANDILEQLGRPGALEFRDEDNNIIVTGADVVNATAITSQNNIGQLEYSVSLEFNQEGARKFEEGTRANVGKRIFIYYDNALESMPIVRQPIAGGNASISDISTFEVARDLASTIRIGALPIELKELRSNIVGAKLGQDAIDASILAGLVGLALVILFMIAMYKVPGVVAGLALLLYVSLMIIFINLFNITLTLPGIAGIILSIGMAVDANVIIFSRIKEELAAEKTLRSSIKSGFNKATSAILDGNITTLIAAIVLFWQGTGPIRGFAQTLGLGIILSMITALLVSRVLMNLFMQAGLKDRKLYGIQKEIKVFDVIKNTKRWFVISIAVILVGLVAMPINLGTMGDILNYDIEFVGGTSTLVEFNEEMTFDQIEQNVRPLVAEATGDNNPQLQRVTGTSQVIIKTRELGVAERSALYEILGENFGVEANAITSEGISATVSSEMRNDAIIAVIIAAIAMLIYITIRFRDVTFGASAVVALLHDILVVLAVYSVFRIPINNSFIAAMLTIVGYSINDTIVLFDRIRENKVDMKRGDYKGLINSSISQTIGRSINTSITTFLMISMLFVIGFGITSLREFALPLMVGILSGTYSSIFIASPLWNILKKKEAKKA